ncbi:MAG: hypothetical protein MHM6MM_003792 [Cercozoa sp. M6MM]
MSHLQAKLEGIPLTRLRTASAYADPGESASFDLIRADTGSVSLSTQRSGSFGASVFAQQQVLDMLQADQHIEFATGDVAMSLALMPGQLQPNMRRTRVRRQRKFQSQTTNDADRGDQWNLDAFPTPEVAGLNADGAYDNNVRGSGINIAVIDTGVLEHEDLTANYLRKGDGSLAGYDFVGDTTCESDGTGGRDDNPTDPGDYSVPGECYPGNTGEASSWHGTHVSGIAAAVTNNALGVMGVASNAKILPLRVLGTCGSGFLSDIIDAIRYAGGLSVTGVPPLPAAHRANVINLSLGGVVSASTGCPTLLQNAINDVTANGVVVVAASGNDFADLDAPGNNNFLIVPAGCANVMAVGALQRSGTRAPYSNYGNFVDIAAPGGWITSEANRLSQGILSTLNTGTTTAAADTYYSYMGTSMATPHLAGVVALAFDRLLQLGALTAANISSTGAATAVTNLVSDTAQTRGFPSSCDRCGVGAADAGGVSTASP